MSNLAWQTIQPGVERAEVHLKNGKEADRLWLYRPVGQTANLPCVVIAPAGTRLFHGMLLGDGDMDEHIPYVKAGFAVVAYELPGPLNDNATDAQVFDAARKFKEANGGIKNAQAALDAAQKLPWVNPKRLFLAGHSSAATLALEVAAVESSRVAGCAAFAPEVNVSEHLAPAMQMLEGNVPGIGSTLGGISPHKNATKITCPLFLFVASDDDVVNPTAIATFADQVRGTNHDVTFTPVPSGGHYDAMIQSGIPAAIRWMQTKK